MQLSRYIDHTLLKPEASRESIEKLCREARQYNFFSVCVNSSYVHLCSSLLKDSQVKVCSVVGFPLGAMDTESKAFETSKAIANGASEIDMVIHIGALKSLDYDYVQKDIEAVVKAAQGNIVKVIIETSLLTEDEKKVACEISLKAGAHFVKTSTGFGGGGATLEDILLMKSIVKDKMQIKASGGVKDIHQAQALINAGASRFGTSSGVTIIQGGSSQGGY